MSIVKMKKLRLLAIRAQRDELLRELMLLGCVEVAEPPGPSGAEPEGGAALLRRETSSLSEYRAQHAAVTRGLQALSRYAPEKTGLFTRRPAVKAGAFFSEEALSEALELASELARLDSAICDTVASAARQRELIASLRPWEALGIPLETKSTLTCSVLAGTIPAAAEPGELEKAVCAAAPASQTTLISSGREQHCLLVVCLSEELAAASEALRRYGFSQTDFGPLTGTAGENIAAAQASLKELAARKKELAASAAALARDRTKLLAGADFLGTKIARAEAAEKLMRTESVLILNGWVPAPRVKALEELLARFGCAWELSDPSPDETADVPVCLKDGAFCRPAMMITEMYSLPSYDGVDPNPLIMPFFCLFFGIMFADIAYGLILVAVGLVIKLKIKPRGTLGYAGGLLIACGAMSAVFGAITGNFFGDVIPVLAGMFGKTVELPTLVDIFEDPMVVLIGSLVIGFVHIMVGMAVKAWMLIRDGCWKDALCDVGSIWLLFAGIALGALGVTWLVALAGVAAIVGTQGRSSKTIGGKIGGGLWELYSIATGYFGDILSYSRLMALMLAGSVIASVFNTLGAMFGNMVFFILLFLVGHALNMALNIIGTFVHTSRLQYLEFFGKFYRDGGRPFAPLSVTTNNVDIIKED